MKIIGTAGHVDHGKTTLVKALSGIDPDRLKEEKEREMTIELGFAWMKLPGGEPVGIIDVPGHRDFIENMLAGVGGIDAVLFIIAADEGVMPQTKEHLAILQLLDVRRGVIALTKTDMVIDPDWIDLITKDIKESVKSTFLQEAKIVPVSAKSDLGMDNLISALQEELLNVPDREDNKKPRLSVDRSFSIQGYGTVVTGTLLNGKFQVGDEICILPSGKKGRIRGLQTHKLKIEKAEPGSRVAVNISNLEVKDIPRGSLVALPNTYLPSLRVDAYIQLLKDAKGILKHNDEVKLFHLASEHMAHVRILEKNQLTPGENGYIQIEFKEPIIVDTNDRFVMRIPSPGETIGGGVVLKIDPPRRYKRFSEEVIEKMMALHIGSIDDKILDVTTKVAVFSAQEIGNTLNMTQNEIQLEIDKLKVMGDILQISSVSGGKGINLYTTKTQWNYLCSRVSKVASDYHKKYPMRIGIPKEELRIKLSLNTDQFQVILKTFIDKNVIKENNELISLPTFSVVFNKFHNEKMKLFEAEWNKQPYSPPGKDTLKKLIGDELFDVLIGTKSIIPVSKDVVFRKKEFDEMLLFTKEFIYENGKIAVSEFRDKFNTSRKFALAFLEYLDKTGVTIREGDFRILVKTNK